MSMNQPSKEEKAKARARQRAQITAARRERVEQEMAKEAAMIKAMEEKLRKQKLKGSPVKVSPITTPTSKGSGVPMNSSSQMPTPNTLDSQFSDANVTSSPMSSFDVRGDDGDSSYEVLENQFGFSNGQGKSDEPSRSEKDQFLALKKDSLAPTNKNIVSNESREIALAKLREVRSLKDDSSLDMDDSQVKLTTSTSMSTANHEKWADDFESKETIRDAVRQILSQL